MDPALSGAYSPQPANRSQLLQRPSRGTQTLRKAGPGFPSQGTVGWPAVGRLAVTAAERGCGDIVSHSCYKRLGYTCSSAMHFSVCMLYLVV